MVSSLVRGKKTGEGRRLQRNSQRSLGGAERVRKSIEKTSSNGKNRAVVLWEYSYNERGNFPG